MDGKKVFFLLFILFSKLFLFLQPQIDRFSVANREATLAQLVEQRIRNA